MFEPELSVLEKEIVVSLLPVERSERPALQRVKSPLPITCAIRCNPRPTPITRVEAGAMVLGPRVRQRERKPTPAEKGKEGRERAAYQNGCSWGSEAPRVAAVPRKSTCSASRYCFFFLWTFDTASSQHIARIHSPTPPPTSSARSRVRNQTTLACARTPKPCLGLEDAGTQEWRATREAAREGGEDDRLLRSCNQLCGGTPPLQQRGHRLIARDRGMSWPCCSRARWSLAAAAPPLSTPQWPQGACHAPPARCLTADDAALHRLRLRMRAQAR